MEVSVESENEVEFWHQIIRRQWLTDADAAWRKEIRRPSAMPKFLCSSSLNTFDLNARSSDSAVKQQSEGPKMS